MIKKIFLILAFILCIGTTEEPRLFQPEDKDKGLWTAQKLYKGAEFIRETDDSVVVWLQNKTAKWQGDLYLMCLDCERRTELSNEDKMYCRMGCDNYWDKASSEGLNIFAKDGCSFEEPEPPAIYGPWLDPELWRDFEPVEECVYAYDDEVTCGNECKEDDPERCFYVECLKDCESGKIGFYRIFSSEVEPGAEVNLSRIFDIPKNKPIHFTYKVKDPEMCEDGMDEHPSNGNPASWWMKYTGGPFSVAGLSTNSICEFGFEEDSNPETSDMDYNDIIFQVKGLRIGVKDFSYQILKIR